MRGIAEQDIASQPLLAQHIAAGALAGFKDDGVIIGSRLAFRLGLKTGDPITFISPQGTATAFGTVPRIKSYTVAGTFNVGMYEFDNGVIFMPLDGGADLLQSAGRASRASRSWWPIPTTCSVTTARSHRRSDPRVRIFDWQQSNLSFFNAVEVERNVMFLILTLIIVVAAFNIISSMIMLVKDKGRDIAILRTMGATHGMILRIFMLSGASVGVVGTLAGFVLGVAFASNIEAIRQFVQSIIGTDLFAAEIYFLTQIPARIDPDEVGTVLAMAFGLSFLATIYPSWRAARLDPVEALRYE